MSKLYDLPSAYAHGKLHIKEMMHKIKEAHRGHCREVQTRCPGSHDYLASMRISCKESPCEKGGFRIDPLENEWCFLTRAVSLYKLKFESFIPEINRVYSQVKTRIIRWIIGRN